MSKVVLLIVCVFLLLQGSFREVDTYTDYVVAKRGDTFYGLVEPYYDKCELRGLSWNEYSFNMLKLNENLFADGRGLQPGDTIKVEYYKERK